MILLEIALAVVLVWALACGSLILGGCISVCTLSCGGGRARYERRTLFNFGTLFKAAPTSAQPASKGLQTVAPVTPLAKVSDDAATEAAKKPTLVKKVAIGTGVLGGVALLLSGVLGSGCEKLMGANNCAFVTAQQALNKLTRLPAQLAEGVVFVAAGAFVIGTTMLAHNLAGNGWLTAGTFTVSTFVTIGIVNRED